MEQAPDGLHTASLHKTTLHKVTMRQLQMFIVAAETLSFQRAADALELTPPAVSMQMSRLGEELGTTLFEKKGRQVVLTAAGEALLPYARRISQLLQEASERIGNAGAPAKERLTVAMVTTSRNFGPQLVARFQAEHPEVRLDMRIGNHREVIDLLEHEEVDLALMGRVPGRVEVEATSFAKHPYVVIAAPDHPLAGVKNIPPAQLVEETFLAREAGSGTRIVMEHFFEDRGLDMPRLKEMSSNENIKQAVMAQMGLAVISRHTLHLELLAGKIVELDVRGMPEMRSWRVVKLKGRELTPAARQFRAFVKKRGPELMRELFGEA
jgi:DNA-binding transcriptional LysR family regulator